MAAPKDLFRQKVNVNEVLTAYWHKCFAFNTRQLINKHLLSIEDVGISFEHQGRTFTILGMTENEHMIVTEQVDGRTIYWETTTYFVQMKLNRFYVEWKKVNGVTITVQKDYDIHRMHLPSHKASRKKRVDDEAELVDDETIMETYVEDTVEDDFQSED